MSDSPVTEFMARLREQIEHDAPLLDRLDGSKVCLREVVVTCGTATDPAWIDATHVLCLRPLPCNNPHHKPDAGREVAATGGIRAVPPELRGQR